MANINQQTGPTRQVEPGAHEGIAILADGTPIGKIVTEEQISGAITTTSAVIQKVGKINFGPGLSVVLNADGSITVDVA